MLNQDAEDRIASINAVVVDDKADVVKKTADLVRNEGYPTEECTTGAEGFTVIAAQNPWLLVVGETLQDMAGHVLLLQLLQAQSVPPCIIMLMKPSSGGGFGRWTEFGPAREMPHIHIGKPFNPAEFRLFVRQIHDQYERTGSGNMSQESEIARDTSP